MYTECVLNLYCKIFILHDTFMFQLSQDSQTRVEERATNILRHVVIACVAACLRLQDLIRTYRNDCQWRALYEQKISINHFQLTKLSDPGSHANLANCHWKKFKINKSQVLKSRKKICSFNCNKLWLIHESWKHGQTVRIWDLGRKEPSYCKKENKWSEALMVQIPLKPPKCSKHVLYPYNWEFPNSSVLTTIFLIWIVPTVIDSIALPHSKNTLPIVAHHLVTMTFLVTIHWLIRTISTIIISITKVFLLGKK
jgi:hypothetical protein